MNKIKIPRTTEDYTIRRHQEMGPKDQKQQQEQKTISSVTSLRDKRLTAQNITAQLN